MSDDPPPISEHGVSNDEKEFLYQVGGAITQWAQIDERLFRICAAVLGANKQHVAIIYYRTPTISARLTLTDDLLKTVLPQKDKPNGGHDHPTTVSWKSLKDALDGALKIRNQLAHSPAGPRAEIKNQPDGTFAVTDTWWSSYESGTEKLRGNSAKKADLKISDVKDHAQKVGQLWAHLRDFESNTLPALLAK